MFGGSGCGKSTTAAGLFHEMKKRNYKVELIPEWIKGEGVWENRTNLFGDQDYIFAHQHRTQRRLIGHDIEYAITDSPILLSLFYMPDDFPRSFEPFVRDVFDSYDNLNIFIDRNPELIYTQTGRNEDLAGAIQIDNNIRTYFEDQSIKCNHVLAGDSAVLQSLSAITHYHACRGLAPLCSIK
jgi:GTPase SAR1 family protein